MEKGRIAFYGGRGRVGNSRQDRTLAPCGTLEHFLANNVYGAGAPLRACLLLRMMWGKLFYLSTT